jgi:Flp pilus assembly protein TadG
VRSRSPNRQKGQAIVLVALMILVLLGFVGLAIDSGRAYLDRRHLQSAADGAALAAAYTYMNTSDYAQSEQTAAQTYASNEALYGSISCSGLGTVAASCTFGDPSGQLLSVNVTNKAIAGVSFAVTVSHSLPVAIMQVLGSGPTVTVGAAATAVARKAGTNGAAILTLSPGTCSGTGASMTFQGNSKTFVTGDIWSNGSILDQSASAGGSVNGNVIDTCGTPPALGTPTPWTVTGSQANGWTMPDPNYPMPALNATSQSWNATSGSVEHPGAYANNPSLAASAGCYFLGAGVYNFQAGMTQNGGFISNELRPPDEPNMAAAGQPNTTTTTALIPNGGVSSIPVAALSAVVPGSTTVSVDGQTFTVDSGGANAAATSIPLAKNQSTATAIASGAFLSVRSAKQFWDSNGVSCGSTFSAGTAGSTTNNLSGTYSVEVTAVRWEANGTASCSGPATPTCYLRETSPSMCKTVTLGSSSVIKVSATTDPGAQDFNVYLAQNSSCTGLAYVTSFQNSGSSSVTINSSTFPAGWPTGQASPPDGEGMPLASGLPNASPPAATPPHGDLANEGHCVDTSTGSNVACPASWTPGAVVFFIPSGGCLDLHGKGDIYLFSGYQLQRVVLYEPGPEQSAQPNACTTNIVNGNGFTSLIGIFYMPAAGVTINGNSAYQATIAGGVIAWTASVIGTGNVAITADPTLRTWPPSVNLTQ